MEQQSLGAGWQQGAAEMEGIAMENAELHNMVDEDDDDPMSLPKLFIIMF